MLPGMVKIRIQDASGRATDDPIRDEIVGMLADLSLMCRF